MGSKWKKYESLLTKSQKEKYDEIIKNETICKEAEERAHNKVKEQYVILETLELTKEAQKFLEKYRQSKNEDDYDKYRELLDKAEEQLPALAIARQAWREKCEVRYGWSSKAEKFRSSVYTLLELPTPKGTPTDDETKQCIICKENIKDHALPCGHIYCVECVEKMNCNCPTCKKKYSKNKIIKLFF